MKIFFDHCVPKRLIHLLTSEHEVRTARADKKNGGLLSLVAPEFEVFLTVDQNIKHQQNLSAHSRRFIVLIGRNNRYETLSPQILKVRETLPFIQPGELVEIS